MAQSAESGPLRREVAHRHGLARGTPEAPAGAGEGAPPTTATTTGGDVVAGRSGGPQPTSDAPGLADEGRTSRGGPRHPRRARMTPERSPPFGPGTPRTPRDDKQFVSEMTYNRRPARTERTPRPLRLKGLGAGTGLWPASQGTTLPAEAGTELKALTRSPPAKASEPGRRLPGRARRDGGRRTGTDPAAPMRVERVPGPEDLVTVAARHERPAAHTSS
jgi:hypothetical protein